MDIVRIAPVVQAYDWGSADFIPQLLGRPSTGGPAAEAWFGTHPGGMSTLPDFGDMPLSEFLHSNAQVYLGARHLDRYGADVPFLLKVLAIEKPLSIQCHPDRVHAKEGYERELASHASLPRDQWNYKDANQKAEVLHALDHVTAMCSFLPVRQIAGNLAAVVPHALAEHFPFLEAQGDADAGVLIERFLSVLYALDHDSLAQVSGELAASLAGSAQPSTTADGRFLTAYGIARSAIAGYPVDAGLLAPFFLHIVHLSPGQAIFLEPRVLHAYVRGNGVEIMSNSDNVLRGGLTRKKVDAKELLANTLMQERPVSLCPQVRDSDNRINILAPVEDFVLRRLESGTMFVGNRASVEVLLCTQGSADIHCQGEVLHLGRGQSCLIAASVPSYRITVEGQVFSASTVE